VPVPTYKHMVREEETVEEAIRTAQIVPPSDRGQDLSDQQSPAAENIASRLVGKCKHKLVRTKRMLSIGLCSLEGGDGR